MIYKGKTGSIGPPGNNGAIGSNGLTGSDGAIGNIGPTGSNGAIGPVGSDGIPGNFFTDLPPSLLDVSAISKQFLPKVENDKLRCFERREVFYLILILVPNI